MADERKQDSDPVAGSQPGTAERVIENLAELEPELKAAAILGPGGEIVASTGISDRWAEAAGALLEQVDSVRETEADSAHIAIEGGEVFLVREGKMALVAVTERFVLASLTSYDMRMALRDLEAEATDA